MISSSLIAIVDESSLSAILPRIYRAGLGQTARVLRPERGPLRTQMERARVPLDEMPERVADAPALLFIMAAARSELAARIALAGGASACWNVSPAGRWSMVDDGVVPETPVAAERLRAAVTPAEATDDIPAI